MRLKNRNWVLTFPVLLLLGFQAELQPSILIQFIPLSEEAEQGHIQEVFHA